MITKKELTKRIIELNTAKQPSDSNLFVLYKKYRKYIKTFYSFRKWVKSFVIDENITKAVGQIIYTYNLKYGKSSINIQKQEEILFIEYIKLINLDPANDLKLIQNGIKSVNKKKEKQNKKKQYQSSNRKDLDFYSTPKWIRLREKVKRIFPQKCMKCNTEKGNFHVDHIFPRSLYPSLEYSITNLQLLCKSCNLDKSNKEEIDYRTEQQKDLSYNATRLKQYN